MRRRHLQRLAAGGAILVVTIIGAMMWILGDSQTKQSELGAGLVSTGLLGLLLVGFERVLSAQTMEVDRKISLAATPIPARDDRGSSALVADAGDPDARVSDAPGSGESSPGDLARSDTPPGVEVTMPPPTQHRRRFRVELDVWMRDSSRVDAEQLRLVVWADDDYFQFFTAIVPGSAFRISLHSDTADGVTLAQFRRGLGELAVRQIRQAIANGDAPRLDDPTVAIEVFPDTDEAVRIGRGLDDREHEQGEVIGSWLELPGLEGATPFVRRLVHVAHDSPIGALAACEASLGTELARLLTKHGEGATSGLSTRELTVLAHEHDLIPRAVRDGVDALAALHTMALLDDAGRHLNQEQALEAIGQTEGLLMAMRVSRP